MGWGENTHTYCETKHAGHHLRICLPGSLAFNLQMTQKPGREFKVRIRTCYTECFQLEICSIIYDKTAELINLSQFIWLAFKVPGIDSLADLLDLTNINYRQLTEDSEVRLVLLQQHSNRSFYCQQPPFSSYYWPV